MSSVTTAVSPSPSTSASTIKCPECGSADVSSTRKFPPSERVGSTFVCPKCAAIGVIDKGKARALRTHEWAPIVLEPFGFELLEHRLTTAKKLKLA